MREFIGQHFGSLILSVLFHGGLVAFMTVSLARAKPVVLPAPAIIIEAEVVDQAHIDRALAELEQAEQDRKAEQNRIRLELEQREEQERRKEADRLRKEQIRLKRSAEAEAERKRLAEEARLEAERLAEEKRAAEKRRIAEEKQRAEQAERQRIAREKADAERRAREEEERLIAAYEDDLNRELEEEARRLAAVNSGEQALYVNKIRQKVVRSWRRPPSAEPDLSCKVKVRQARDGSVLSARITECNTSSEAVRNSVEKAVFSAEPLPLPSDPTLWEANIEFTFKSN